MCVMPMSGLNKLSWTVMFLLLLHSLVSIYDIKAYKGDNESVLNIYSTSKGGDTRYGL